MARPAIEPGIYEYVDKAGKKWYIVRLHNPLLGKKEQVGTYPRLQAARDARDHAKIRWRGGELTEKQKDITLDDLFDQYLAMAEVSASTKERYEYALKPARAWFKRAGKHRSVKALTRKDTEGYVCWLKENYAASTVHLYHAALYNALQAAVRWEYRKENPTHKTVGLPAKKSSKEIQVISVEEHEAMVGVVHPHFRTMFYIWPMVGLRRSEMFAIQWPDIDFEAGLLHVSRQLLKGVLVPYRKSREDYTVVLMEEVVEALREHRKAQLASGHRNPDNLVFTSVRGHRIGRRWFYDGIWNPAAEKVGRPEITPHVMRHTFVTWNFYAGIPLPLIAAQAGHADPVVTAKTYAHLMPKEDHLAAEKLQAYYREQRRLSLAQEMGGE